MLLSNNLSDDAMLHAAEPLLTAVPSALTTFVTHPDGRIESVAHILTRLWTTSALAAPSDDLTPLYEEAATAVTRLAAADTEAGARLVLRCLRGDPERVDRARAAALAALLGDRP
jgi:hypothetical protein